MPLSEGPHFDLLQEALGLEAGGQRALLDGDTAAGADALRKASARYRASWDLAPPASYGRLIGALKAAIIARDAGDVARYVRDQVEAPASPPSAYALALAALALGDDDAAAAPATAAMREGSPAFGRAADAIDALAARDRTAYAAALAAIVADFEGRDAHLTGVPIADTALMLERLAEPRGLAAGIASPLLPAEAPGQPR